MGRFKNEEKLLNDVAYRMMYAKKVCDILNKHLPEDQKIQDADIVKKVFDSNAPKKYTRANEFNEKMAAEKEAVKDIVVQAGPAREVGFFKGTKQEQIELRERVSTVKGAKEYAYESLVKNMEIDPTKIMTADEDLMVQRFMENPYPYAQMFCSSSCLQNQHLTLSPEIQKIYNNQKSLIEGLGSNYLHAIDKQANPLNMLIPDVPQVSQPLLYEAMTDLMELSKDENAPDIFKDITNVQKLANNVYMLEENKILTEEFQNLQKDGKIPDKMMLNTKYTVEGKEVNFYEYTQATREGKTRAIVERTQEEKEQIKDALYNGKAISYGVNQKKAAIESGEIIEIPKLEKAGKINTICNRLEEFSKNINKTNSVFSKDSEEFKKMRDLASQFAKDYQKAGVGLDNPDKLVDFYKSKEKEIKDIQKAINDYSKAKEAKNKSELDSGKKLSSRSETRFKEATNMKKYLENSLTTEELEYTKVEPQPYRDHSVSKLVKADIKAAEKQNEKKMVKELSLSKEKQIEADTRSLN